MTTVGNEEAHTVEGDASVDKDSRKPLLGTHPRRFLWLAACGPLAWALALLAQRFPTLTESVYGSQIGPRVGWLLARATGWFSFSLAEIALALVPVVLAIRLIAGLRRGEESRLRRLLRHGLFTLRDASLVLAAFLLVFGLHYARPTLPETLGWERTTEGALLVALAIESTDRVNDRYLDVHAVEDLGRPTPWPQDVTEVDRALEAAWPRTVELLRLPSAVAWERGPAKPLRISPLLHHLGLSGFYFPWTGEANVNRSVPAMRRAFTYAHEKAHQRGIAREDEASFTGWVTAELSDHPLTRYASAVYAHRRLVMALSLRDGPLAQELVRRRLPGVQRDVEDLVDYWESARGPATDVAHRVNDAYLRGQGVHDGVFSYGRSTQLLLDFAARRGNTLDRLTEDLP